MPFQTVEIKICKPQNKSSFLWHSFVDFINEFPHFSQIVAMLFLICSLMKLFHIFIPLF